jgi:putative SOS response-associated peptidase YedK
LENKYGRYPSFRALEKHWKDPQGNWPRTFTIVAGEPNELVASIHDRMPVILRPQDYGIWLGEKPANAEILSAACAPFPADEMRAYPISTRVNSPRNDDSGILEEAAVA